MTIGTDDWEPRFSVVAFRSDRVMGETVAIRPLFEIAEEIAWRYVLDPRPGFRRLAYVFIEYRDMVRDVRISSMVLRLSADGGPGRGSDQPQPPPEQ